MTQGTYLSPVFGLLDPTFYNPAFVSLEGGLSQAESALIAGIQGGQSYFNIHTGMFPSGEIRTQLFAVGVPGPVAGAGLPALIAACGVMLMLARRRRQRAA